MKIYSAYRSNMIPNNRFAKTFEAESVLEVFQRYYQLIADSNPGESDREYDLVREYFGVQIYGAGFGTGISEEGLQCPKTIEELSEALETHWYSNEVEAEEHCIQLYTDDDEIDLAWYVFDEMYAQQHPERVQLYTVHTGQLPAEAEEQHSFAPGSPLHEILPAGAGEGCTYMICIAVYDGEVIGGLEGGGVLNGVRLPEFPDWLRSGVPSCGEFSISRQLNLLANLAKGLPDLSATQLLERFAGKPLSDLSQTMRFDDILGKTPEELAGLQSRCNPAKSNLSVNEHLWELQINCGEFSECDYYDYIVLFDDVWAASHPLLAENLLRFGSGDSL